MTSPSNGTPSSSIGGATSGAALAQAAPIASSAARNWAWSWVNTKLAQW